MKLRSIIRYVVAAGVVLSLSACGGAQVRSTAGERIPAGTYSIVVPATGEWEVKVQKEKGMVELLDASAGFLRSMVAQEHSVRIMVFQNTIMFPGWGLPEAVAGDFLDNEVETMREKGVEPGLYSLSDVAKGTEAVGSKTVHYLRYKTGMKRSGRFYSQDAALYLYFPQDFRVSHRFYGFLFQDLHTGAWLGKVDLQPLREVIASFSLTPPPADAGGVRKEFLGAVCDGDLARVKEWLGLGAEVNYCGEEGTPLLLAALYGQEKVAQCLLEAGASPEGKHEASGATALMAAVVGGQERMARVLIERGADVNARTGQGRTPLILACAKGRPEIALLLVEKGARINERDAMGVSPLMRAAYVGQTGIAGMLLDRGAEINAQADDGWTSLMVAIDRNHPETAAVLLERHADVNLKARNGWTALLAAVLKDQRETARCLIERGADVNARNEGGVTPLGLARSLDHDEIGDLLAKAGAREK